MGLDFRASRHEFELEGGKVAKRSNSHWYPLPLSVYKDMVVSAVVSD